MPAIDFQTLDSTLAIAPEFEQTPGQETPEAPTPEENPFNSSNGEHKTFYDYIPDPVSESDSSPVFKLPDIIDSAKFIAQDLPEPAPLINGLVHQGTKVIVGGGSKSFKTWVQLHAALCVAYGQKWLGFDCTRGRVLFVNFEIQPSFFQKRITKLCECLGITQEPDWLHVWNLRGYSAPYALIIPKIIERVKSCGYSLIILDPIYKLYGSANENDASEVAQLLNSLEKVCVETGAAVMFGAHYSKGNQSQKESIDRISGSGVFARDPDSIIPFTKHENEGSFVIEPTLRNLPPVQSFVVSWNYPIFERDDDLDPSQLKQPGGRKKEREPLELLSFIKTRTKENPISIMEWAELANCPRQTLSGYLDGLRTAGLIATIGDGKQARKFITEKGLSCL